MRDAAAVSDALWAAAAEWVRQQDRVPDAREVLNAMAQFAVEMGFTRRELQAAVALDGRRWERGDKRFAQPVGDAAFAGLVKRGRRGKR
ncbi:MAG: hypothetical protein KGK07_07305 [Chloroflexota bacterium]|nr:hypothetical protein [Chloroflexota bacterium]